MKQIPNYLTTSRILLAFIFPFLIAVYQPLVILLALATEFLDGFIARLFKWSTRLGEVLDPIADKIFFLSVGLTWIFTDTITWLDLFLLGTREIGIFFIFVSIWLKGHIRTTRPVKARTISKITTALQYFALFSILFYPDALFFLLIATSIMGLLSAIEYYMILTPKKEEK